MGMACSLWQQRIVTDGWPCRPSLSNPSTSPPTTRLDGSGRWDNRVVAQHLPRHLGGLAADKRTRSNERSYFVTVENIVVLFVTAAMMQLELNFKIFLIKILWYQLLGAECLYRRWKYSSKVNFYLRSSKSNTFPLAFLYWAAFWSFRLNCSLQLWPLSHKTWACSSLLMSKSSLLHISLVSSLGQHWWFSDVQSFMGQIFGWEQLTICTFTDHCTFRITQEFFPTLWIFLRE